MIINKKSLNHKINLEKYLSKSLLVGLGFLTATIVISCPNTLDSEILNNNQTTIDTTLNQSSNGKIKFSKGEFQESTIFNDYKINNSDYTLTFNEIIDKYKSGYVPIVSIKNSISLCWDTPKENFDLYGDKIDYTYRVREFLPHDEVFLDIDFSESYEPVIEINNLNKGGMYVFGVEINNSENSISTSLEDGFPKEGWYLLIDPKENSTIKDYISLKDKKLPNGKIQKEINVSKSSLESFIENKWKTKEAKNSELSVMIDSYLNSYQ